MNSKNLSRRDFLRVTGLGSAALLLGNGFKKMGVTAQMEPFVPDAEVTITAHEKYVQILSGAQTRVWSYQGQLSVEAV